MRGDTVAKETRLDQAKHSKQDALKECYDRKKGKK